jgi:hypothetical protein
MTYRHLLAALVVCLFAVPLQAERERDHKETPPNNTANKGNTLPNPAPVNTAQTNLDSAKKALDDAQLALSKATTEVEAVRNKLLAGLQVSPEFVAAKNEQLQADAVVTTAKATVLTALTASKPAYKVALAAQDGATVKAKAVQDDPASSPEDKALAWQDVLKAESEVSKMEGLALDGDTAYQTALSNANTASAKMRGIQEGFDAKIKADPAYTAAAATVTDAKKKVDAAQIAVDAAAKAYTTAANKFKAEAANYKPPKNNPPAIVLPVGWTSIDG